MNMVSSADINAVLTANSMRVHYVLMANGIFHNHLPQGIVGLHRLGASEERIKSFIELAMRPDSHGGGLVKATEHGFDPNETKVISDIEAAELLGKSEKYYQLVHYYDAKLKNQYGGSVEAFIKGEMRHLGDGILSEITHAIIEIGHGYSVGQVTMVVEGMAWLHYNYKPPKLSKQDLSATLPAGPLSLHQMLTALSNDARLKEKTAKATGPGGAPNAYKRLEALWLPESSALLDLLNQTNLEMPTDPVEAGNRLVDIGLTIYIASKKRNEFFLLHGATGAWSVKQIMPLLDAETARMCLRTFLLIILGVYVMEGSPPLDFSFLTKSGDVGWPEIIARALAREDADPHRYKLVQVCHDLAQSGPAEKQTFYKAGALVALDYDESRYTDPVPN